MSNVPHPSLEDAKSLLDAATSLLERAVAAARSLTSNGKNIDDHQVITECVAYAATEAVAAHEVIRNAEEIRAEGRSNELLELAAVAAVGHLVDGLRDRVAARAEDLGIGDGAVENAFPAAIRTLLRRATAESLYRRIGAHVAETGGRKPLLGSGPAPTGTIPVPGPARWTPSPSSDTRRAWERIRARSVK